MKQEKIVYTNSTSFLGRNGRFIQSGLEVWTFDNKDDTIKFQPTTSKGETGRCMIQVPKENIQDLIDILEKLK